MKIKSLKYTVSIEISENWISDGFQLTEDNLRDAILSHFLPYARESEIKVKILDQPKEETIAAIKGDHLRYSTDKKRFIKVRKPIQATVAAWRQDKNAHH